MKKCFAFMIVGSIIPKRSKFELMRAKTNCLVFALGSSKGQSTAKASCT